MVILVICVFYCNFALLSPFISLHLDTFFACFVCHTLVFTSQHSSSLHACVFVHFSKCCDYNSLSGVPNWCWYLLYVFATVTLFCQALSSHFTPLNHVWLDFWHVIAFMLMYLSCVVFCDPLWFLFAMISLHLGCYLITTVAFSYFD